MVPPAENAYLTKHMDSSFGTWNDSSEREAIRPSGQEQAESKGTGSRRSRDLLLLLLPLLLLRRVQPRGILTKPLERHLKVAAVVREQRLDRVGRPYLGDPHLELVLRWREQRRTCGE